MKRIAALLVALGVIVGVAQPAGAYTHLGATSNPSLSVQWSNQLYVGGHLPTSAIVVRSDSFADSLAAGALAGALDAPVLMTPPGEGLSAAVENELGRVLSNHGTVRIIGGTEAVSAQVESDLSGLGYSPVRIAGTNRVATAGAVMNAATNATVYGGSTVAYLVRGFGDGSAAFADSLGAGMLAGTQGAPLLLTETQALSADTRSAIQTMGSIATVRIVGGSGAVNEAVAEELTAMGITVERIAGLNRFETAARVADESFVQGGAHVVALVEGLSTNSWASGYPASAAAGGAVVLSSADALPAETTSFLQSQQAAGGGLLVCAPEVDHNACVAADSQLNG
jgi:putative cell wall-binding protein